MMNQTNQVQDGLDRIHFLYQSASPPALKRPPIPIEAGYCAFTGEPITTGYHISSVITSATSEVSDTFRYPSESVSVEVAELFRAQTLLRGNLLFLENELLQPMVSRESAKNQNRPCWRDLMFEIEFGTPCVAVFTDESKRRLWPQAQYCSFGEHWRPFVNGSVAKFGKTFQSPQISRTLSVDVLHIQSCISLIESVQSKGFTKHGIYRGLLHESNHVEQVGYHSAIAMEKALRRWRDKDEFLLALFISQGTASSQPKKKPKSIRQHPTAQLHLFD